MDACYKNICQKMELSYFNDFSNDNLINDEVKNKSVKTDKKNYIKNETDLIEELIQNDFKFNEKNNCYYLTDENMTYNFLPKMNIIQMTYNDGDDKLILKVFLNIKKVSIASTCDGLEKNIYISDYTNKKDKNYKTFKKYYDNYLSKYFRNFLVV